LTFESWAKGSQCRSYRWGSNREWESFKKRETLLVERFSRREKGRGLLSLCLSNHETLDIVPDGVRIQWASRETLLRDMLLGLTHNLCRPGVRVGCFVGSRLPRRYHEACTALAVYSSGENRRWAYALLYYDPRTKGSWQPPDCPHCPRAKGERGTSAMEGNGEEMGGWDVSARLGA
jgi:hypothetical protein